MSKQINWRLRGALALACTPALAAMLFATPAAATCPNEAFRPADVSALPECLGLEMVTPPKKFIQPALLPSFSRDGSRLLLSLQTALPGSPGYQNFEGDRYVALRTAAGWDLVETSPPVAALVSGGAKLGGPSTFTPDLGRWAQLGATQAENQVGVSQLFGGGLDGSFAPLSPRLVAIDNSGSPGLQISVVNLVVAGSSEDLSRSVLRPLATTTAFLPQDPRSDTVGQGGANSYLVDSSATPTIELLARDKEGKVFGGRCGSHLGGEDSTFNQGAISADGSRIFFTTRPAQPWDSEAAEGPACSSANPLRILERTETSEGPVISEPIPGGPAAPGDDLFEAASADGTKLYLTTTRKLTAADSDSETGECSPFLAASKGCDLYLYDASKAPGERLTLVSDAEDPVQANVPSGIAAVSGDGSRAYFAAPAVLTSDLNPLGDGAQGGGKPNLYLYEADTDELSFLATLSSEDQQSLWGTKGSFYGDAYAVPLYGPGLQGGGEGHVLAFATKAPVTADDEDGGFRDAFRFDAEAETLERISKAPEGGSDNGPFEVSVNPAIRKFKEENFNEMPRWASEDGQLIAFATAEPLLPGDGDEQINPYVWDEGQLGAVFASLLTVDRIEPPAVAPVGEQFAFATTARLLPRDGDTAKDVYVAREGGGIPEPLAPPICNPLVEGACQGPPPPPPPASSPATTATTAGNVKPTKCKKGQVKRKGKCVKKKQGKHKAGKRAGRNRGEDR